LPIALVLATKTDINDTALDSAHTELVKKFISSYRKDSRPWDDAITRSANRPQAETGNTQDVKERFELSIKHWEKAIDRWHEADRSDLL
jgi:hypothetical protein